MFHARTARWVRRFALATVIACAASGAATEARAQGVAEEVAAPVFLPFPDNAAVPADPAQLATVHEVAPANAFAAPAPPAEPKSLLRPLAEVVIDTRLPGSGAMPGDAMPARGAHQVHAPAAVGPQWADARPWMTYEFAWHASGLAHRPNYFEDLNLERYGNSACPTLQPAISAARFAAQAVMLPYNATVHRPRECIYMLGYCRPGNPAPNLAYYPPLRLDAAAVEAAAITGAVFIIP